MPSPVDLTALTAAVTTGFADVTAAITASQSAADLAPLVAEVERVADAFYVQSGTPAVNKSITQIAEESNMQIESVIGTYSDGERVKVYNETPGP